MQNNIVTNLRSFLGRAVIAAPLFMAPFIATSCQTSAGRGALGAGAVGAGIGAVVGHNSHGRTAEGAAIGAALGAATGAIAGHEVDKQRRQREATPPPRKSDKVTGHYENRIVRSPNGEQYEERVWVPDPR